MRRNHEERDRCGPASGGSGWLVVLMLVKNTREGVWVHLDRIFKYKFYSTINFSAATLDISVRVWVWGNQTSYKNKRVC